MTDLAKLTAILKFFKFFRVNGVYVGIFEILYSLYLWYLLNRRLETNKIKRIKKQNNLTLLTRSYMCITLHSQTVYTILCKWVRLQGNRGRPPLIIRRPTSRGKSKLFERMRK